MTPSVTARFSSRVALVGAIGLTAALFLGHEAATREAFDSSLASIGEIVDDAMPAVIQLSELRASVREVRADIGHATRSRPEEREKIRRHVEALLALMDHRIRTYEAFRSFPSEKELHPALDA